MQFGGASVGITYSTKVGRYWFNGNSLNVCVDMILSSKGSSTGTALITGLPLTARTTDPFRGLIPLSYTQNFGLSATTAEAGTPLSLIILENSIEAVFYPNVDSSHTALTDSVFNNNSGVRGCGSYYIK